MKTIFRLTSAVLFLMLPLFAKSQTCTGNYTFTTNGLTVNFSGTVSSNVNYVMWDFGDGNWNTSNQLNVSHTYAAPGNYTACIQYYDSMQTCADSTCHLIVLDSCAASFIYIPAGLTVAFDGTAFGAGPNASYYWWFSDNGNNSNQEDPTYTFSAPGTYNVCFSYYNPANGCSDSVCMPVTVGSSSCNVDFTWIDSMGYVFYISTSTLGNGGYYYWDFGDGNYSTQMNPSHVYSSPGTYNVCVTVYDSMQNFCDSTCHQVIVQSQSGVNEMSALEGSLQLTPNPADDLLSISFLSDENGPASITFYDAAGRVAEQKKITAQSNGMNRETINTSEMPQGIYLVKVEVNGSVAWSRLALTHQ